MQFLDVRVEGWIRMFIERAAKRKGVKVSDIFRDLVVLGIDLKRSGGFEIVGPFGLRRSLAMLDFGGGADRIGVRLEKNLTKELERVFGDNARSAARQAVRLGILRISPGKVKIRGALFGLERPFAQIKFREPLDEKAKEALSRLRRIFV
jgi:hypothetical protein